jgi:hypothetical protein
MSESNQEPTSGGNASTSGDAENQNQGSTSGDSGSNNNAYSKLLREKKNYETQYKELKAWKDEYEEKKLLDEKQYGTVIENLKGEVSRLKDEKKVLSEKIMGGRVNTAILSEAKKLGFNDNEENRKAFLKLIDKGKVAIDPTTDVVIGADEAAKSFYSDYSKLGFFGNKNMGTNQNAPAINTEHDSHIDPYIRELRNCKTQREFDEVRKKYNRS